jgi:hypothetical protein
MRPEYPDHPARPERFEQGTDVPLVDILDTAVSAMESQTPIFDFRHRNARAWAFSFRCAAAVL